MSAPLVSLPSTLLLPLLLLLLLWQPRAADGALTSRITNGTTAAQPVSNHTGVTPWPLERHEDHDEEGHQVSSISDTKKQRSCNSSND